MPAIAVGGRWNCCAAKGSRHQLEVNVVGQVAVTQAMIPLLRLARGRIVNMASVNDALPRPSWPPTRRRIRPGSPDGRLRLELRQWGIFVCVVEPARRENAHDWGKASRHRPTAWPGQTSPSK